MTHTPDYKSKIEALRRKASDPAVGPDERKLYEDKAKELEDKHGLKVDPPFDFSKLQPNEFVVFHGKEHFDFFSQYPNWKPQDLTGWRIIKDWPPEGFEDNSYVDPDTDEDGVGW